MGSDRAFKRHCDSECQPLVEELARHDAPEHIARKLAVRFWNLHGPKALEILTTFLTSGWAVFELSELQDKGHEGSRLTSEELAFIEQRIIEAGWSAELARRVVINCPAAVHFSGEALRTALELYRHIGLEDADLRTLAIEYPRALATPRDIIQAWDIIRQQGRGRLARASALCRYQLTPTSAVDEAAGVNSPQAGAGAPLASENDEANEDEEEVVRDWRHDLPVLFRLAAPSTEEGVCNAALVSFSWVYDGSTRAMEVLDELARWIEVPRVRDARENMPSIRLIARLCADSELQPFLRLEPDAARFRLAVIRRFILKPEVHDLGSVPRLLVLPWEEFSSEEWRYRTNVLKDRGLPLLNSRILALLFKPLRQDFNQGVALLKRTPS
jgi:hypothetical protein